MVRSRTKISASVSVALGVLGFSVLLASCGEGEAKCSSVAQAYNLVGTVLEHHGNHAEFVIESIQPSSAPRPVGVPPLAVGGHVKVHYDGSTAQFLHVGSRYVMGLWWLNTEYWSDIHTADRPCSGGTVHADGSSIDTSLWARSPARQVVYVVAVGVVGVVGVVGMVVTRHIGRVQRRRRRTKSATFR